MLGTNMRVRKSSQRTRTKRHSTVSRMGRQWYWPSAEAGTGTSGTEREW